MVFTIFRCDVMCMCVSFFITNNSNILFIFEKRVVWKKKYGENKMKITRDG